jgi:hypothetical protein
MVELLINEVRLCKMKLSIAFGSISVACALLFSSVAMADKVSLKTNISTAREKLLALVAGGDVASLKAEIGTLTASVDGEVDTVPGLKPVWEQFKTNRDTKIIPAYDGTKPDLKDAAKALAGGEQKELFGKMMDILK